MANNKNLKFELKLEVIKASISGVSKYFRR